LHLQVGKRESLNRPRGDSHSRDALPVGSESHDYLCYFIVQCVPDIQLSNLPAGLQPAHQRLAIGQSERAQDACSTLASSPAAQGNGPFAQALQQIGQDLKSGDLKDAQQALASLQQQQQAHGHHHHHGGGGISGTSDPSQTQNSANASDPDNNDDTDSISIDIQVTETFNSSSKVDIKA
jgi:hypothetical protein